MGGYAAVILAGGAARRMGGADKPALPVAGRPMLARVLAAVDDAQPRVVVGSAPAEPTAGVLVTREEPPGGGPVAATAAGLARLAADVELVALLAADLPLLTRGAVTVLRNRLAGDAGFDGALYRDTAGRRQSLCGVWRGPALRAALDRLRATGDPGTGDPGTGHPGSGDPAGRDPGAGGLAGASMRSLLVGLRVLEVDWERPGPPPWFDCDTDDDLRRAQEWAR